jgi:hypothetical protein
VSVMFLREIYRAYPGKGTEFARQYRREYSAGLARYGFRLTGFWETALTQGPGGEYIAFWEFDTPQTMEQLSKALDSIDAGDRELQAARDALSLCARREEGWALLGQGEVPTLAEMNARGLTRRLCLYEEIDVVANQHALLDKILRTSYLRMVEAKGQRLIGVFRPQLHSVEAVVLWDLEDWNSLAWSDAAADTPDMKHWMNIALTARTGWRGRLLVAA